MLFRSIAAIAGVVIKELYRRKDFYVLFVLIVVLTLVMGAVHFFDDALPRWPTVSLNLGLHPEDAPHQDIWLPQDWEDLNIPVKTLGGSGLGFGQAIFNTAMSWRDSLQSALPGYRNRIAQVRTSSLGCWRHWSARVSLKPPLT